MASKTEVVGGEMVRERGIFRKGGAVGGREGDGHLGNMPAI